MDIMELGAIGELVGGAAVVASLVYVGLQVRQNTLSLKATNAQGLANAALFYATTIGSNPQTALTFNRGLAGDSLDPGEQAQFTYLYHAWVRSAENGYFHYLNGTLDAELWAGWNETSRSFLGSPGGRRMWESVRPRVRASFCRYIETEILPSASGSNARNWLDPMSERNESERGA